MLLAGLITIFHLLIVIFVILAPISNQSNILILHITLCVCLLVHWINNNNACSLTILESKLRGLDSPSSSFTHQFIAPIYDVSATDWSRVCYVVVVLALTASIIRLTQTDNWKKLGKYSNLPVGERLMRYATVLFTHSN